MTKLKKEEVMRATNIRGTNRLQIQFLNGASYHLPKEEGCVNCLTKTTNNESPWPSSLLRNQQ